MSKTEKINQLRLELKLTKAALRSAERNCRILESAFDDLYKDLEVQRILSSNNRTRKG